MLTKEIESSIIKVVVNFTRYFADGNSQLYLASLVSVLFNKYVANLFKSCVAITFAYPVTKAAQP